MKVYITYWFFLFTIDCSDRANAEIMKSVKCALSNLKQVCRIVNHPVAALTSDSSNISINIPTRCLITKRERPSRYLVFAFIAPPANKPHRVNQDQTPPRRISAKVTRVSESASDRANVNSPDSAISMPNKHLQAGERDSKKDDQNIYAFQIYGLFKKKKQEKAEYR